MLRSGGVIHGCGRAESSEIIVTYSPPGAPPFQHQHPQGAPTPPKSASKLAKGCLIVVAAFALVCGLSMVGLALSSHAVVSNRVEKAQQLARDMRHSDPTSGCNQVQGGAAPTACALQLASIRATAPTFAGSELSADSFFPDDDGDRRSIVVVARNAGATTRYRILFDFEDKISEIRAPGSM